MKKRDDGTNVVGSPAAQLAGFLAKFDPAIAAEARRALVTLRKRLPGAVQFVYDNYNALVIGFGPNERPSDAIFSLVVFPRWVTLCFLQGAGLKDPDRLLKGSGNRVRHIRLDDASTLDKPEVRALMTRALSDALVPLERKRVGKLVIRSISAKQRSRRL